MSARQRPIDEAMADDRPAKDVVRRWWVEEVAQRKAIAIELGVPAYLTLPGIEGRDIEMLIEHGVIGVTEAGGIAEADHRLLVAYESRLPTVARIKQKFANLDVQSQTIQDALRGPALDNYPDRNTKKRLRALVVNLDLNSSWKPDHAGEVDVLAMVEKLGRIHGPAPDRDPVPWCLALTLHAQLDGEGAGLARHTTFLQEQAAHHSALKDLMAAVKGDWLTEPLDMAGLRGARAQTLLILILSTKLAGLVDQGWELVATHVAAYGHDVQGRAPMVTFVISLKHDHDVKASPVAARARFYCTLGAAMVAIDHQGGVEPGWPLDPVSA